VIVAGEPAEAMGRSAVDQEALTLAIRLHEDRIPELSDGKSTGRRSFALWREQLGDQEKCGPHYYHRNVLYHIRLNRQSAPPYLREMARRHQPSVGDRLELAARGFEKVLQCVKNAKCTEDAIASASGREALAYVVEELSALEDEAHRDLQSALDAMK
jgi:hypothetical protein